MKLPRLIAGAVQISENAGDENPWARGEGLVVRLGNRVWSRKEGRSAWGDRLAAQGKSVSRTGKIAYPYSREDDS